MRLSQKWVEVSAQSIDRAPRLCYNNTVKSPANYMAAGPIEEAPLQQRRQRRHGSHIVESTEPLLMSTQRA